jgi:hypothetical protein
MNTRKITSYKNDCGVEMKPTCRLMWDGVRDKEKGGYKTVLFQLWTDDEETFTHWHEVPHFSE